MKDFAAAVARVAPTLATLALLVLGGFLAARWVTYFAAPSGEAPPPARERPQLGAAAQALAGAHLFGVAPAGETVSNLNVKLRGVFAGGGTGTGYAIVNAGGRDQATRIGGEWFPASRSSRCTPATSCSGARARSERVNLEERTSAQAPAAAPPRYAQATPPAPRPAACDRRTARAAVVQPGCTLPAPGAIRAGRRRRDRIPAARSRFRPGAQRHRRRGRCRVDCRRGW